MVLTLSKQFNIKDVKFEVGFFISIVFSNQKNVPYKLWRNRNALSGQGGEGLELK